MKTGNLLFSAVQFIFAILVFLLGGFFIGLQYTSHLRYLIAQFFSAEPSYLGWIGFLTLGCGVLLLIGFCAMHRGIYYRVKMRSGEFSVDPAVIRSYLSDYWKEQFPKQNLSVEVCISKKQKLEMFLEFPALSLEEHQAILEKAEVDVGSILRKHLGYKNEFGLSVLMK